MLELATFRSARLEPTALRSARLPPRAFQSVALKLISIGSSRLEPATYRSVALTPASFGSASSRPQLETGRAVYRGSQIGEAGARICLIGKARVRILRSAGLKPAASISARLKSVA